MSNLSASWKTEAIGDVCDIHDSRRIPLSSEQRRDRKGPYPYYGANNIQDSIDNFIFDFDAVLLAEDGGYYDECETRDIAQYATGKYWVNNHAHILTGRDSLDTKFLYYALVRKNISPWINTGTRAKLNQSDLRQIEIPVPPLPEQKKIAEILSAIDNQINLIASQVEQAKKAGTALTKQLLSSFSGDFLPLSEVATNYDSQRVPIKSIDREGRSGPYRYFGASGVIDMIDDYLFDGEFILVGEDGANIIDRNKPLAFRVAGKFWVNNHAHVMQPKSMCDLSYLTHYLESLDYTGIASGSAQPKITRASLDSIQIPIPPIEDQRKIGAAIDSAFNLVKEIDRKKHKLLSMKSAISSDLLSGRKRVSI